MVRVMKSPIRFGNRVCAKGRNYFRCSSLEVLDSLLILTNIQNIVKIFAERLKQICSKTWHLLIRFVYFSFGNAH